MRFYVKNFSFRRYCANTREKVKFVNNGASEIEIASGPHPTHTSYPAFKSDSLAPGATYEFTATEKVTIKYHNHLNPSQTGTIIVK